MEKQYPGPYCREINLSIEELNNSNKIQPIDHISNKNGVVFEILNTCKNLTEVVTILNLIQPKLFESANVLALKNKLNRLKDVRKKSVAKKKVKGYKTFSEFMETPFGPLASKTVTALTLSHTMTLLTPLGNEPFENTVGKGEVARNEQFLLFPQCFLPVWITVFHLRQI